MRRAFVSPAPLFALAASLALVGCAPRVNFTPMTPLEQTTNGLYQGEGVGLLGRVPYRLTLAVQERSAQASGVLHNLDSGKVYAGSGTFRTTPSGGWLNMNFFENGQSFRAAIHAELQGDKLTGQLKTVVLGKELLPYTLKLRKVEPSAQ